MIESTGKRRVCRDKDPLKHRRVRDASGLEGTVRGSYQGTQLRLRVHWDNMAKPWDAAEANPAECDLLDAPDFTLPVFVRKVIFRGHKEQVAEIAASLAPLKDDRARRFIEFDPQPAAYRRWRLVYQGPPLSADEVRAIPDVNERAVSHRNALRDAQDYTEWEYV